MFHDWQIFHLSARHPKIAKLNPPESRHHEGTCVVIIWPFWLNHCCLTAACINILNKGWCEAKSLMFNYWLSSRQDVADNFNVKALPQPCLWSAPGLVCHTVASLQELSTTYLHDHFYLVLQQTHRLVWCHTNCYITAHWFSWCFYPEWPTVWIQSNNYEQELCKYLKNVELLKG